MSSENTQNNLDCNPQEYIGNLNIIGGTATITELLIVGDKISDGKGLMLKINLKDTSGQNFNERVCKWVGENDGKRIRVKIEIPFKEDPSNYAISLMPEDGGNMVTFEAEMNNPANEKTLN